MSALYEAVVAFISHQLKCPICFELFSEPVSLECGHSYCLQCITDHLKQNVKRRHCPQCRAELRTDRKLHKNVTISAILELQEVGGREMWDSLLTESEEEFTQRKQNFLKQEMKKSKILQAECFNAEFQIESCSIRDRARTCESSSSGDVSSSSLDCDEDVPCAERSASVPPVPQIDEVLKSAEAGSLENRMHVSEDPDTVRGISDGGAAAALGAEFVSLTFSPHLVHRRLVFLSQRQRMEVRSSLSLRPQPCHFEACQCMADQEFTTGRHYWDVETSECTGWAVGVAYAHLKKNERLGRSKSSWCIEWSNSSFSAWHDGSETPLKHRHPSRLRVRLDVDAGHISFWSGADGETELCDVQVEFSAPVRPMFWLFGTKPGNALFFPKP
ncbi:E3 ubiquitin/ISG15 ligase TRIM25 [Silurus meridionalis]|uniref:Uncharacterized protein n=1 Tax=Silurus meridionalis TaxID=175797 RepID=A0A8T0BUS0_SILME|nr:E3 ubiquitin/ISG15 ligase TRIM25 [Silurus meridionalis]KAF7711032.1 hypothetical protein HF521_000043 [Silurus meridionalis]